MTRAGAGCLVGYFSGVTGRTATNWKPEYHAIGKTALIVPEWWCRSSRIAEAAEAGMRFVLTNFKEIDNDEAQTAKIHDKLAGQHSPSFGGFMDFLGKTGILDQIRGTREVV